MTFEIDVVCEHPSASCDCNALQSAIERALNLEEVASAVLSVTLVDNQTIHRLNREHLQHDYPTDVISYPLEWMCPQADYAQRMTQSEGRAKGANIEGEIVASIDYAEEMARRCGWKTENELTLYAVHGMLHICGYDDLSVDEKQVMRSRERAILEHLGIEVTYPDDAVFDDDEPPGTSAAADAGDDPSQESSRS